MLTMTDDCFLLATYNWLPSTTKLLLLQARKLVDDVTRRGLGLLVAADWHDPAL